MGAVATARSPEQVSLELGLPLLGSLHLDPPKDPLVCPGLPDEESARREALRSAERVLRCPRAARGALGVAGDLAPLRRAQLAGVLGAALALERTTVLVDADLRGAHLAAEERARAQEGLVDVLRYGVRSPRVVLATRVGGLSLLPVGSGTVMVRETYRSEAARILFAELRRRGDLILVNAPDREDLPLEGAFGEEISSWVLVHEIAASDLERTRELREGLGSEACLGLIVLSPGAARADALSGARPPERDRAALPPGEEVSAQPAAPGGVARWRRRILGASLAAVLAGSVSLAVWRSRSEHEPAPSSPGGAELPTFAAAERASRGPGPQVSPGTQPPASAPQTIPSREAGELAGEEESGPPGPRGAGAGGSARREELREAASDQAEGAGAPGGAESAQEVGAPPAAMAPIFGIHVSSLRTEAGARKEAALLEEAGYPTLLRPTDVPGRGRWVRVYVGPFGERAEARRVAAEIRASGLKDWTQVHRLPREELLDGKGREDR